ncbi:MAG: RNA 2',3'-cyclic phosphodiesterase [Thermodesulforhabdaceae bacterium]
MIRTFIAIDLPESVKKDLKTLQNSLIPSATKEIRWVNPEGIHLTLKFLGDVELNRISEIEAVIADISKQHKPFELTPQGCGVFPSWKSIRVIWVGLVGDLDPLKALYAEIEERLEHLGFARENREFTPHLTIGRAKNISRSEKLSQTLAKFTTFKSSPFVVDEIVLFKSTLTPSRAIYQKLSSASFDLPSSHDKNI